jgi:hypothetical protein
MFTILVRNVLSAVTSKPAPRKSPCRAFGRARFRPTVESVERRQLLTSSAVSTLGGVSAAFSLDNGGNLSETLAGKTYALGGGITGLFQGHDAAGHRSAFITENGQLYESTPGVNSGWTWIASPASNQVVEDQAFDVLYQTNGTLYETTGAMPSGNTPMSVAVANGVKSVYQGRDSSGHDQAYALENGLLYQIVGNSLRPVAGPSGVTQVVINGQGQPYTLQANGVVYSIAGSTATQATVNATRIAVDPAGEIVVLHGSNAYDYLATSSGGLSVGSGGIAGPGTTYSLDGRGRLYQLGGGVLSVMNNMNDTFHQVDTGVTRMAIDPAGEVVYLTGPSTYHYIGAQLGSSGSSTSSTYFIDAGGRLYQLGGGVLSVSTSMASGFQRVATGVTQAAIDPAGELVILQGTHAYQYFGLNGLGTSGSNTGVQYVLDGSGRLFSLSKGTLTLSNSMSSGLQQMAAGVSQLTVNASGAVVIFQANRNLWTMPGNTWSLIGKGGILTSSGAVWYLGTNADSAGNSIVSQYANGRVQTMGLPARAIGMAEGTFWAVNSGGSVFRLGGGSWNPVAGATSGGNVWFLGTQGLDIEGNRAIYRFTGGQLVGMNGSAIAFGSTNGNLWLMHKVSSGALTIESANGSSLQQIATVASRNDLVTLMVSMYDTIHSPSLSLSYVEDVGKHWGETFYDATCGAIMNAMFGNVQPQLDKAYAAVQNYQQQLAQWANQFGDWVNNLNDLVNLADTVWNAVINDLNSGTPQAAFSDIAGYLDQAASMLPPGIASQDLTKAAGLINSANPAPNTNPPIEL